MLLFLFLACRDPATDPARTADLPAPRLVPAPVVLETGEGSFTLQADTSLAASTGAEGVAELLARALRPSTGYDLPVVGEDEGGEIQLLLDASLDLPAGGYTLEASPDRVVLQAPDRDGLLAATQTLRQLLPPASLGAAPVEGLRWRLPAVWIEDAPRFAWRGLMIDVARHFFTIEELERQVELMALHKLNRLHLHLTDDQGWRIEIRSWPDLTAVGGSTEVGGGEGGWYTQAQFLALVAYAAERGVTVIPEIDFPGHAHAALASYPELNEGGEALGLYTGTSVISTPLWLEGASTWGFVEDVWTEVALLAPDAVVHVGGDEAEAISEEDYSAFLLDLQALLASRNKRLAGRDEIGIVVLQAPFHAQHWYHEDLARDAVGQGATLIRSPAEYTYLDMIHDEHAAFGQFWAGAIDVVDAWDWEPVLDGLDEAAVIGLEGALWTEFIDTEERMDLMVWPRMASLAERAWSPAGGEVEDFAARMGWHGARLEALDVGYYQSPSLDWTALAHAGD